VSAPGASSTGLQPVTVPAFSAVTVPLSNPAAGQPLVASAAVLGGTATMTFPAGTTVTPGTSVLIKTVTLPTLVFVQSHARSAQAANAPGIVPNPGLYVQVLDGVINVANSGGSQQFAAGQFGFTPGFAQPPIILPSNPGLQFTPPPTFVATVDPSGNVGTACSAKSDAAGDLQVPVLLNGNKPTTLVLGGQSMFTNIGACTDPSTASAATSASATAKITLPAIEGGFSAAVTVPAALNGANATINASFSLNAPSGVATIASRTRVRQSIGGSFTTSAYVTLSATSAVSFASTPSFTFTSLPGSIDTSQSQYLALFDPTNPSKGWTTFAGPGAVSGQTVTFASAKLPTALAASTNYQFALINTAQTLAVPTPGPTSSPTPSPTPSPTASPSPTPTPSPTPLVLTQTTAAATGGENAFSVPLLTGLTSSSAIFYSQTVTSATQSVTVSASTGNFANLALPANQTPVLFLTVSFASGTNLTFDASSLPMNLAGTLFTIGTTYTMTPTLQGVPLMPSTAIAETDDHPGAVGGLLEFTTPREGYTLLAGQQVGIVISH
jgi:hypothetical protein